MKTMYRVNKMFTTHVGVKAFDVVSETDKTVTFSHLYSSQKSKKNGVNCEWFDTEKEAIKRSLEILKFRAFQLNEKLDLINEQVREFQGRI